MVNIKIVSAIKYGLNGSIQENVDAIPLVPAINAKTGVIQHNEAAIAVIIVVPINFFSELIIYLLKLYSYLICQKMELVMLVYLL